jgi:hypothetical protein
MTKPLVSDALKLLDLFGSAFEAILQVFAVLPKHEDVRGKTIFFLRRMVDSIGEKVIPYLPTVLEPLIKYCDATNVLHMLTLVTYLIITFRGKLVKTLDPFVLPIVSKAYECIQVGYACSAFFSCLM